MSSTKYTSRPITNKIPKDLSTANFKVQKIEKETSIEPIEFVLKKEFYGRKEALLNLDEEFKHFILKKYSVKEFFKIYNKNFFDIDINTHRGFMYRSIRYAYPEGYQNFRTIEIQELESKLTGDMLKDFETKDEIQRLTMIKNGVKPATDDDIIECVGCGS